MANNLQKYATQTNIRLVIGFGVILLVIGVGLIYLFYGQAAAVSGLLCIGTGVFPLILIWGALKLMDVISKRNRVDDLD